MKFTRITAACLLSVATLGSANAFDYVVCRAYEFEELKTFSSAELQSKYDEYESIYNKIGAAIPQTAREVQEDFNDRQKCSGEMERLKRILDARAKAESKVKPGSKKTGS